MQFPCARCARTYEIADELVIGRAVKVACPACGNLAVHRVPSPSAAPVQAPPPPPPAEERRALADADDDDFDSALDALDGLGSGAGSDLGGLPAAPAGEAASAPAAPPPSPAVRPAPPAPAARPPPPAAPSIDDAEPVMVTAELVLRRSNRRSRIAAAVVAVVAVVLVVGGGALALKLKKAPVVAGPRGGSGGPSEGTGTGGNLSEADLAKLLGKKAPEPEAPAPAPAPRPAEDRPKHEKLARGDKLMLDLLAKKGDAKVAVQEDVVAELSTSRGTLDEAAIEATLARSSGSFMACVNRAIQSSPEKRLPAQRVNLELTVRPSGRVAKAAVQEAAIARLPLGQCIAQAAKRMVFPGFDGEPLDLVVPLKLKVGL